MFLFMKDENILSFLGHFYLPFIKGENILLFIIIFFINKQFIFNTNLQFKFDDLLSPI